MKLWVLEEEILSKTHNFCVKIPKSSRKTDCYHNNIEKIEESKRNRLKKTIGIYCAKCIFYKLENNDSAIMTGRKGK